MKLSILSLVMVTFTSCGIETKNDSPSPASPEVETEKEAPVIKENEDAQAKNKIVPEKKTTETQEKKITKPAPKPEKPAPLVAPENPTNFQAPEKTLTSIKITWQAAAGDVAGYRVRYSDVCVPSKCDNFESIDVTATEITLENLNSDTWYYINVVSVHAKDNTLTSEGRDISVQTLGKPAPVSNLRCPAQYDNRVTWSSNEREFYASVGLASNPPSACDSASDSYKYSKEALLSFETGFYVIKVCALRDGIKSEEREIRCSMMGR